METGMEQLYELSTKLTEKLRTLDPTSKEYATVLRHKLDIEEMMDKYANTNLKAASSKKDDDTKRLGIWVTLATALLTFSGKIAFDTWWSYKGFQFEEDGTIGSKTFKRIIDNFHKK